MSYSTTTPQSGQSLGSSRPTVQNNFSLIQTTISQDHGAISSTNQGKHSQCTFPNKGSGASNSPITLANEVALYSALDASGNVQVYGQYSNNASATNPGIQLTRLDTGASVTPTPSGRGYSFLPGGMIIQWGIAAATSGAGTTTTFPIVFPNYCFGVALGIVGSTISSLHSVWVKTAYPSNLLADRTQFQATSDSGAFGCFFIAIGN